MHVRRFAIPLLALAACQSATAEQPSPSSSPSPQTKQPAQPATPAAPKEAKPPEKPRAPSIADKTELLAPIQVESLTLQPIAANPVPKEDLDVLVLDEAFAQKLVAIREKDDESVNNLTLTNNGDRPLFLLAGEVIIGGKQDRIIGQNTIITAKTTQTVPVFCVEHGRWDKSSKVFSSGKALAHGHLRHRASFEDQGEVWREVSKKNAERKTTNSTDTYRHVAAQQSNGTLAKHEKAVKDALGKVPADDRARMVGYVVAINGKVATVDMFDGPKLFKKLEDKLLRSYLTESVDIVAAKDVKPPSVADIKSFMSDADKAVAENSYDTPAATTVRAKGEKAGKATVEYKMKEPYEGKMAKPVYKTYQAK
jgi:hypothetical protein